MKIKKICDFYELNEEEIEMIIKGEIYNSGGIESFYSDSLDEKDFETKEEYLKELRDYVNEYILYTLANEVEKIIIYDNGLYDIVENN